MYSKTLLKQTQIVTETLPNKSVRLPEKSGIIKSRLESYVFSKH